jgi:hypothetical protein
MGTLKERAMLLLSIVCTVVLVLLAIGLGWVSREDSRLGEWLDEREQEREEPWNAV